MTGGPTGSDLEYGCESEQEGESGSASLEEGTYPPYRLPVFDYRLCGPAAVQPYYPPVYTGSSPTLGSESGTSEVSEEESWSGNEYEDGRSEASSEEKSSQSGTGESGLESGDLSGPESSHGTSYVC